VVLHGKPLKTPSFNVVLLGDINIFDFTTPMKLQASTTNKLMLSFHDLDCRSVTKSSYPRSNNDTNQLIPSWGSPTTRHMYHLNLAYVNSPPGFSRPERVHANREHRYTTVQPLATEGTRYSRHLSTPIMWWPFWYWSD
jgi:hypothetical protein